VMSASRFLVVRWMRLRPAVVALAGVARAPELVGPDSSSRRRPRVTSAKAGAALVLRRKPRGVGEKSMAACTSSTGERRLAHWAGVVTAGAPGGRVGRGRGGR